MKTLWISLIFVLSFALAGCDPSRANGLDEGTPPSIPMATPSQEIPVPPFSDSPPQGETTEMTPTTPADPGLQNLIERAKQDLVRRLNIAATQISLVETKAMVWRDASLGCPKPGIDYIRVEVPGYLISLTTGGKTYHYHTDEKKRVVLCSQ